MTQQEYKERLVDCYAREEELAKQIEPIRQERERLRLSYIESVFGDDILQNDRVSVILNGKWYYGELVDVDVTNFGAKMTITLRISNKEKELKVNIHKDEFKIVRE